MAQVEKYGDWAGGWVGGCPTDPCHIIRLQHPGTIDYSYGTSTIQGQGPCLIHPYILNE